MIKQLYSGLLCKRDGSTIIEFAIIAPVFFLLMFGVTEFGLFMYHKIIIERIAVEISRVASIGKLFDSVCTNPPDRVAYIKCVVKDRSSGLINSDKVEVQIVRLSEGSTTTPDICLDNPDNPSSAPATCSVYEDVNNDGEYKGIAASNAGNAGDVVEVRISYPWIVQFPLIKDYFGSAAHKGIVMVTASTVIKNEPF